LLYLLVILTLLLQHSTKNGWSDEKVYHDQTAARNAARTRCGIPCRGQERLPDEVLWCYTYILMGNQKRATDGSTQVSIIGAGYVGLVTGVCLAYLGNNVTLIDSNREIVAAINSKVSPIYEEGLAEILHNVKLKATSDYRHIAGSQIIILCVDTPLDEDGTMFLGNLKEAAGRLARVLEEETAYQVVVVKSTVIPGTTEELIIPILEGKRRKAGRDFGVCMSPEFLREGKAVHDFMNPARVIVGEFDRKSGDTLLTLYKTVKAPLVRTNLRTAEMIKVASNAFLSMKISFINEIGNISKELKIDTYEVARGLSFDDRIGGKFLNAGIGFGGSCLPKDLAALIATARSVGYAPRILEEIRNLNEKQALKPMELLKKYMPLKGTPVGLLGLSFKPGTNDIRGSRAIAITQALIEEGAIIKAYDPLAMPNFKKLFPQIAYVSAEEVLACEAILILTEWAEFENLDYTGKVIIDGRRIAKAKEARIYEGVCW